MTLSTVPPRQEGGARPLDDLLLYRLSRLLGVAGSMVIRQCEGRFGITRREWRLIAMLASRGALSSSQLAAHAQLDRARTSKAVGSMVAKQLVSRTQPGGDRRHVLLSLTPAGQALYDELYPWVSNLNAQLLAALDEDGVRRLDEALIALQCRAERLVAASASELPKADRRRGRG